MLTNSFCILLCSANAVKSASYNTFRSLQNRVVSKLVIAGRHAMQTAHHTRVESSFFIQHKYHLQSAVACSPTCLHYNTCYHERRLVISSQWTSHFVQCQRQFCKLAEQCGVHGDTVIHDFKMGSEYFQICKQSVMTQYGVLFHAFHISLKSAMICLIIGSSWRGLHSLHTVLICL